MSGILRLESLTKGNTLRQGDLTLLKYRLFDADGDKLDISGKPATVRLMKNDFTLIAYEKEGLTVASDDTISFNINKILPGGLYHLEVIVDDKFIFPSRADEAKFTVDKSSLGAELTIIENAGIDAVVRKAVDLINQDPSLIIDEDKLVTDIISNTGIGSIEEYYQQFNDVIKELSEDKDYHSLPEISAARGGHDTLGQRLDETTAQLAQKATKSEVDSKIGELGSVATFKGSATNAVILAKTGMAIGDEWYDTTNHQSLRWNGTTWVPVGGSIKLGNGTVTTEKIKQGDITPSTLSFPALQGIKSQNLFDKNSVQKGFYVSSGGTIVANPNYNLSGHIPIKGLTSYSVNYLDQHAIFDSNGARIAGGNEIKYTHTVINMPANAATIRLSVPNNYLDDYRLTEGTDLKPYTPFAPTFDVNSIKDYIPLNKLDPSLSGRASPLFDDAKDRMILPPRMYFIKEINLPLYKQGFLLSELFYDDMKTAVSYINWSVSPPNIKINYFQENLALDSQKIENDSLLISMRTAHAPDYVYERGISRSVVSKSKLTGLPFKMLNIGDSLTQNQVAIKTKEKLTSLGATVTLTGTKAGGIEGRGSWAFTHFIGRSSIIDGNYMSIYTAGDVMDNWKNPFLKTATSEDKMNHPNWCFRHTPGGALVEKSYAEDTDKTGNFYIFDFAYYLSAHGLQTPDVITVALGTNDLNIANMRLGLEVIIKQIKKALPNVKIGVVPTPSVGSTPVGNEKNKVMLQWAEYAMADVENYQSTYNNLHIIPAWCHINRDFVFDYSSTTTVSPINKVQKRKRDEFIHANDLGISEYVNVLTAFVANVV